MNKYNQVMYLNLMTHSGNKSCKRPMSYGNGSCPEFIVHIKLRRLNKCIQVKYMNIAKQYHTELCRRFEHICKPLICDIIQTFYHTFTINNTFFNFVRAIMRTAPT